MALTLDKKAGRRIFDWLNLYQYIFITTGLPKLHQKIVVVLFQLNPSLFNMTISIFPHIYNPLNHPPPISPTPRPFPRDKKNPWTENCRILLQTNLKLICTMTTSSICLGILQNQVYSFFHFKLSKYPTFSSSYVLLLSFSIGLLMSLIDTKSSCLIPLQPNLIPAYMTQLK